jgi:hypothetical protein
MSPLIIRRATSRVMGEGTGLCPAAVAVDAASDLEAGETKSKINAALAFHIFTILGLLAASVTRTLQVPPGRPQPAGTTGAHGVAARSLRKKPCGHSTLSATPRWRICWRIWSQVGASAAGRRRPHYRAQEPIVRSVCVCVRVRAAVASLIAVSVIGDIMAGEPCLYFGASGALALLVFFAK